MDDRAKWTAIMDIVTVCRRMWQRGFVANHDGNVTVKIDDGFLATPTAIGKADIIPEIILTLNAEGQKVAGPGKPFSEMQLHLAAYRARPDVGAVVHAHPPYSTARGVCNKPLDNLFMPEAIVSIGDIVPVAPFAMPGSSENDSIVASMLMQTNVFMLPGNGVLAVGSDVTQAYLRLELVEHLAKMDFIANHIGKPLELSASDKARLVEKHASSGLAAVQTTPPSPVDDPLRQIIMDEIKSVLSAS